VHGHAADVIVDQLALAGVDADTDLDAQIAGGGVDRQRAAQGARGRPVEGRQEAIANRLDGAPTEARELLADRLVVLGEQIAPATVAQAVACTMSVNMTVSRPRTCAPPLRAPVRNSSTSSTIASLSPMNGKESTPSSST
jgi:hypothetical protein